MLRLLCFALLSMWMLVESLRACGGQPESSG